jgi:hypothetical protein
VATRWFLRDITNSLSGTFPTGEQGAGTPTKSWAGSGTLKTLSTTKGTTQTFKTDTVASASAQRHFIGFWCSPPLAAQTISANTWTTFCADSEGNLSANYFANLVNVYVWRPGTGAKVGTIIDGSNGASQGGTEPTSASSEQVTTWTFSGSAVVCQAGDVIIVERWAVFTPSMSSTYTLTFFFDGTTETGAENVVVASVASYIETPQNITLNSANYNETPSETVTNNESVAASKASSVAVAETISTWTESLDADHGATASPSEPVPIAEGIVAVQGNTVALSETVSISELVGASQPPVALSETVSVSEALVAQWAANAALVEGWQFDEQVESSGQITMGDRRYPRAKWRAYRTGRRH